MQNVRAVFLQRELLSAPTSHRSLVHGKMAAAYRGKELRTYPGGGVAYRTSQWRGEGDNPEAGQGQIIQHPWPEVECIAKGKAYRKHELILKVSVAPANRVLLLSECKPCRATLATALAQVGRVPALSRNAFMWTAAIVATG